MKINFNNRIFSMFKKKLLNCLNSNGFITVPEDTRNITQLPFQVNLMPVSKKYPIGYNLN